MARGPSGEWTFVRPDGRALPDAPDPPEWADHTLPLTSTMRGGAGLAIDLDRPTPVWDGTPLDVAWAVDILRR